MNRIHEELKANLPSFVLGDLEPNERSALEVHLRDCAECRAELASIQEVGSLASTALLEYQPPRDLEDRTFALVGLESGESPRAKFGRTRRIARVGATKGDARVRTFRPQAVFVPAMAAAFVALVAATGVLWVQNGDLEGRLDNAIAQAEAGDVAQTVGLQPKVAGAVASRADLVQVDGDNYEIVLTAEGLPATPPGYRYELWLGTGKGGWVSAGSFKTGGDQKKFDFSVGVDPIEFPVVDITLEREDGDPTRGGREIMRGEIDITAL